VLKMHSMNLEELSKEDLDDLKKKIGRDD